MSRLSNLFTAGFFIIFLAILFHYFCRVRRKPALLVQQQVQVPEGYVYPITANINSSQMGQNFTPMQPSFIVPQNVPYPFPYPNNIVLGPPPSAHPQMLPHPHPGYPMNIPPGGTGEDLPPPYHVAVASSSYPPK